MLVTSLQEIKTEIAELPQKQLAELCIQLAKYKKDNKEFLGYLLFQSHNREGFILSVKADIDLLFEDIGTQKSLYLIKKSLRKILRLINKYCKYISDKAASADLLIYFCMMIKKTNIAVRQSTMLSNLYKAQLKKINILIDSLHEDLQTDYRNEMDELVSYAS